MSSKEDKVSLNGTAMPEHCYSEGKLNVEVLVTGGCVRHTAGRPWKKAPVRRSHGKESWEGHRLEFWIFPPWPGVKLQYIVVKQQNRKSSHCSESVFYFDYLQSLIIKIRRVSFSSLVHQLLVLYTSSRGCDDKI